MKKIGIILALVGFLAISNAALAGEVELRFDFYNVSEAYVKFSYEFGSRFGELKKGYSFSGNHLVEVYEGTGTIEYNDGTREEDLVIVMRVDKQKKFLWVRVRNLLFEGKMSEQKVEKKAEEFSRQAIERLKELESKKNH